jgi:hypothetical protein
VCPDPHRTVPRDSHGVRGKLRGPARIPVSAVQLEAYGDQHRPRDPRVVELVVERRALVDGLGKVVDLPPGSSETTISIVCGGIAVELEVAPCVDQAVGRGNWTRISSRRAREHPNTSSGVGSRSPGSMLKYTRSIATRSCPGMVPTTAVTAPAMRRTSCACTAIRFIWS